MEFVLCCNPDIRNFIQVNSLVDYRSGGICFGLSVLLRENTVNSHVLVEEVPLGNAVVAFLTFVGSVRGQSVELFVVHVLRLAVSLVGAVAAAVPLGGRQWLLLKTFSVHCLRDVFLWVGNSVKNEMFVEFTLTLHEVWTEVALEDGQWRRGVLLHVDRELALFICLEGAFCTEVLGDHFRKGHIYLILLRFFYSYNLDNSVMLQSAVPL